MNFNFVSLNVCSVFHKMSLIIVYILMALYVKSLEFHFLSSFHLTHPPTSQQEAQLYILVYCELDSGSDFLSCYWARLDFCYPSYSPYHPSLMLISLLPFPREEFISDLTYIPKWLRVLWQLSQTTQTEFHCPRIPAPSWCPCWQVPILPSRLLTFTSATWPALDLSLILCMIRAKWSSWKEQ